ncbi:RNA polymerase sigma factor [Zunongwangia pacifica]|uniref:Sigma-70 family RNA polymerase sigma factor n=1 Tax=Zunongwangia pacifica TaxID=2911062 RepID=A0A9X1ZS22_9FLAO|nr:sigma-70 family RNA polymerase sigma factor [Zunongwangia pacifica]MCL6218170.1 sigma-70 family RNA polymerase sigma factor [Zunongwangia pacifica]
MKEQYEIEFLSLKDKLSSFIFRLVSNRQDTEDIVQETYLKVFHKIDTFQERSSFKTWVFAIALNTAKNHLDKQKRWKENAQDYGANLHSKSTSHFDKFKTVFQSTPEREYEIKEHINYCFNCINKTLLLKQQICLLLKDVYDFKVSEIMQITNLSEGVVKHSLADARKNMIRIFDGRCAFVNKQGVCHQCTALTGALNSKQNAHIQANELKLVQEGHSADKEYLLNLRLDLVRSIDPLNTKNSIINTYMLENCENWVEEGIEKKILESRPK